MTAEELTNPEVNEKAMVTYLTQFYKAHLRQGAPIWSETSGLVAAGTGMNFRKEFRHVELLAFSALILIDNCNLQFISLSIRRISRRIISLMILQPFSTI